MGGKKKRREATSKKQRSAILAMSLSFLLINSARRRFTIITSAQAGISTAQLHFLLMLIDSATSAEVTDTAIRKLGGRDAEAGTDLLAILHRLHAQTVDEVVTSDDSREEVRGGGAAEIEEDGDATARVEGGDGAARALRGFRVVDELSAAVAVADDGMWEHSQHVRLARAEAVGQEPRVDATAE